MTTKYEPLRKGEQLFLRGCNKDGASHGGFQWPLEVGAIVVAPDWSPEEVCGQGLHGNLNGGGNYFLLTTGGIGLVVAAKDPVDLEGKHKFARCRVLFVGKTLQEAATWLAGHPALPKGAAVHYAIATAGDCGTATAGDGGTATAGDYGTATAGDCGNAKAGYEGTATVGHQGTATAGDWGTATAGYRGTATAGFRGTATAGHAGTATAGDCGTATAGDYGTATAGDQGTATAGYRGTATAGFRGTATAGNCGNAKAGDEGTAKTGDYGTATAGDCGTATAGYQGTATAGKGGALVIRSPDGRLRCAGVDGERIKPNVAYRLNGEGEFEVAK